MNLFLMLLEILRWFYYELVGHLLFIKLPSVSGEGHPVVLLHGWFSSGVSMYVLRRRLVRAGLPVIVPSLGAQISDIPAMARDLDDYLKNHAVNGCVIVGFSMGGIIGYEYVKRFARCKSLVAVGSPFGGSRVDPIIRFTASGRQIADGFPLDPNVSKRTVSLRAEFDQFVPDKSPILKGAKNMVLPITGHVSLIMSKRSCDLIVAKVKELACL